MACSVLGRKRSRADEPYKAVRRISPLKLQGTLNSVEDNARVYRQHKRKEFEEKITKNPLDISLYVEYAEWEGAHKNFLGAKAIWEKALEVTMHKNPSVWINYALFAARKRFIGRARDVWRRAVTILGSESLLWLEYEFMEEKIGSFTQAREVYKQWISSVPGPEGWLSYVRFEMRRKEYDNAEEILKQFLKLYPTSVQACEKLKKVIADESLKKKRSECENKIAKNPLVYKVWLEYIELEEKVGDKEKIRQAYKRAIATKPGEYSKGSWKMFIKLWINYAFFEEFEAENVKRARRAYESCLNVIPHERFSFSKAWIYAAQFERRQNNVEGARCIYDRAIRTAPKHKIFHEDIDMERKHGGLDDCRQAFGKYVCWCPEILYMSSKYAGLQRDFLTIRPVKQQLLHFVRGLKGTRVNVTAE